MTKKKSPLVEVVDVPVDDLQSAAGCLHFEMLSANGKRVYYVFVPWTAVIAKLRAEGLVYLRPLESA